jgi:CDP-glucose 4,6-dehydratase
VMEVLRSMTQPCAAVMVTTDKCYDNKETPRAYSETDPLGGHDPYSASKAAAEIAIDSYRKSFFANNCPSTIALASARAGNVIGGGDWAEDRLVPDCIRALQANETVPVRNQNATRPWQHVLDPLSGYLTLGAALWQDLKKPGSRQNVCTAFNFGPDPESNRTVRDVVNEVLKHWPGKWSDQLDENAPHEAGLLNLNIGRARQILSWRPVWNFEEAVAQTVGWYRDVTGKVDPSKLTREQINHYQRDAAARGLSWAVE